MSILRQFLVILALTGRMISMLINCMGKEPAKSMDLPIDAIIGIVSDVKQSDVRAYS
jgi:vacuolar-type H+-ATPase subunit I/STV1